MLPWGAPLFSSVIALPASRYQFPLRAPLLNSWVRHIHFPHVCSTKLLQIYASAASPKPGDRRRATVDDYHNCFINTLELGVEIMLVKPYRPILIYPERKFIKHINGFRSDVTDDEYFKGLKADEIREELHVI